MRTFASFSSEYLLQSIQINPMRECKSFAKIFQSSYESLVQLFRKIFGGQDETVSQCIREIKRFEFVNLVLSSTSRNTRQSQGSCVLARFICAEEEKVLFVRPAVISKMYKLFVTIPCGRTLDCYVAQINWFQIYPKRFFFGQKSPIELWSTGYEFNCNCFIPIQFIHKEFVYYQENIIFNKREADDVLVVNPLPDKSL